MNAKDKKQLAKQRKEAAKQAQKFHKEQKKQNKKSSQGTKKESKSTSNSKIKEAVKARKEARRKEHREHLTREEKFRRDSEEKLRNLQPQDFEDGYYIDEYSEKKRQEKRAKEIRKQENEVIRRNKKPMTSKQIRIKRIIISIAIFLVVVIIGIVLSLTVLFKTEKIDIEGNIYYDNDQIEAFSNVAKQQNIFLGAWNSTPEEIVKNLPYVESADIGFAIPDTITIKIKNAVPTYAVKDGNGFLIVSSKGRILDTANNKTDDLITLKCGEIKNKEKGQYIDFGDDSVPDILHSVAKSFADNGVDKITGFDISNLSQIIINYDKRIDINIGLPEDIDYKIKTAFTIINEKLDPNKTGTITGTLDVSTCNKNKISHYKPSATQPETEPATTAPADSGTQTYDYGAGTQTYDYGAGTQTYTYAQDYNSYGNNYGTYDNSAGNNTYNNNTYDYNTYGNNNTYDYNTYDNNTYSGGTSNYNTVDEGAYGGNNYAYGDGAAAW